MKLTPKDTSRCRLSSPGNIPSQLSAPVSPWYPLAPRVRPDRPLRLMPDNRSSDLNLRVAPLGVIAGQVVDSEGEPARGATVDALRYVYVSGKKQLLGVAGARSGDRGDFRLFGLRAGTYYLQSHRTPSRSLHSDRQSNSHVLSRNRGFEPRGANRIARRRSNARL